PHRNLRLPAGGTSEQQARDVRTRNQQEQQDAAEDEPQGTTHAGYGRFLERHDADEQLRVAVGIKLSQPSLDSIQVGARLYDRDATLESANAGVPRRAPRLRELVVDGHRK